MDHPFVPSIILHKQVGGCTGIEVLAGIIIREMSERRCRGASNGVMRLLQHHYVAHGPSSTKHACVRRGTQVTAHVGQMLA